MALVFTVRDTGTNELFEVEVEPSEDFHNSVVHPLLVACRPLGEWLHDHTEPG